MHDDNSARIRPSGLHRGTRGGQGGEQPHQLEGSERCQRRQPIDAVATEGRHTPDIDSFARLCRWASVDANAFLRRSRSEDHAPTSIAALLRADPKLDENSASAIAAIVSAAYDKLKHGE